MIKFDKKTLILFIFAGFFSCSGREAAYKPSAGVTKVPPGYQLVWHDEFDKNGKPDTTSWSYEQGFVRNHELQWYQPENVNIEGGVLVI